jgi:serine/threonine protein kinase
MDPLDDGAQQHVIRLLAESGSRSEALAHYDRYVDLLDTELGLEPLEEMVEMVEAIRAGGIGTGETLSSQGGADPSTVQPAPKDAAEPVAEPTPESREGSATTVPAIRAQTSPATRERSLDFGPDLEFMRPIGKGSMAEVYLGREPHLRRLVAVKVLSPELDGDPRARKRFEREAQAAARLNHPHVCTVHRVGTLPDGTPYLVSPFVKGTTLAQRLKAEGRLGAGEVRRVLREVASALGAAHKLGILHRDVRPGNVLRAEETGRHSLCDFGISGVLDSGDETDPKLTRTGEVLGNPAYISPEQMNGLPLTDRSDIYSLGILGHQLLTGHPPPPAQTPSEKNPEVSTSVNLVPLEDYLKERDPELVELIGQCLASNPAHRPSAVDIERRLIGERRQSPRSKPEHVTDIDIWRLIFKKRLPQILGAYIAGAWLSLDALGDFEARFEWTNRPYYFALVTVISGFLAVTILGWFHGEKGRQTMTRLEKGLLWGVGLLWVAAAFWAVFIREPSF